MTKKKKNIDMVCDFGYKITQLPMCQTKAAADHRVGGCAVVYYVLVRKKAE